MKYAPKRLWLVLAIVSFAGILKATLPQITIGNWTTTSSLSQPRSGAATVLMNDGRILFTGGDSGGTAEFFNADGTVSSAGAMNVARSGHFAVVMSDGRVLVGGGNSGGGTTNSAEIYDPSAGTWTAAGVMNSARANATAALLQDGRVVIAGGDNAGVPNNTIEVFDPANGSFTVVSGNMSSPRTKHAMAVLQSGQVLIIGGSDGTNPLASTDVFDPSAGTIAAGPALASARYSATATTLLNGQVAVIGGAGSDGNGGTTDLALIEIFDPTAGAFSTVSANLATAREGHQAYLLPNNNNVLIVGGTSGGTSGGASLVSAELFTATASPTDGSWSYAVSATGAMNTARAGASGAANQQNGPYSVVTPLPGLVIVGGGTDASGAPLASTEAYGYPTVQTDQADYPPGTTVYIQGSGFQANENVTITLAESPLLDTHGPYTVQADGNGNFTDASFTTDTHDENIRFFMSVAGQTSGRIAQNTFTDSQPSKVTLSPGTVTVAPGGSAQYSVDVSFNGNPGSCSSPLSIQTPPSLPAGANATFSPTSASGSTTTDGTSTLTIATNAGTTPPGSTTFNVLASRGTCSQNGTATGSATLIVVENTTTTLATSLTPSTFGQSITLTATVAKVTGPTTPTGGTVTFLDGVNTIGTATLTNGTATLPVSTLSTGSHSLTASYAGVANTFGASASSAITQTVNQASTTTKLASSANPSSFGQSVTFTATVAAVAPGAGNPSGTVTFTDGVNTLGTGTLSTTGGVTTATFTTTTLAVGSHTINASYAGDTNFTGSSTTTALTQTVNTASTTTTLASSANPSVTGQVITFTATVTPSGGGTPTGSVEFKNGPITFATGTLSTSGGVTTATASVFISLGSSSITAVYGGDSNFSGSTSTVLTQVVKKADTTTTLASTPNPSVFDSPVTFTVTVAPVAPGAGAPTGTVTLTMGNTTEGTGTLSTSGNVSTATIVVSTLPVGANGLKASYPGDSFFNASSTPNALAQTVNPAPTTTTLTSSVNPSVFGQSVTFTAAVTVNAPSTGTIPAAEAVTFKDNGTTIGTGTTNASGVATFTTSSLSVATHPITATYAGDTNFATSTSSAVSQVVNPAPTTTVLTSATNPSIFGQSVTFTATVTVSSPGVGSVPAGDTVTFKDGATILGTGTTNASGVATFATSALNVATHSITAVYAGDTNLATSTSNTVSQVVNQANTTTTVVSSLNPSASGQSVTFTATVAAVAPGSGNPTGTVTFKDGSNSLGTGTLSTTAGVTTATLSTSTLTPGSHSITAVYGGDTNFHGSTSSALAQNVVAPPSITKSFGAPTVPLNGSTSLTFTITNPAANTVTLSGLAFTDTLPSGMVIASTPSVSNTCNGTVAATAGTGSISLSGGSVAAGQSCTVSVNVTGTTAGQKSNSVTISSTNGGTGNTSQASIIVDAPPTIAKAFGAPQINLNTTTSLTITISNSNQNNLTGISFHDSLPAGLVIATPPGLSSTCGGTATATAGANFVNLLNGTVNGNSSCAVAVNVLATTTGLKSNTIPSFSSNEGGSGGPSNTATVNVVGTPPTITSGNSTTFTAGVASSFPVTTSGTPTASLSETGTLPGGVSFTDNGNGTATLGYNGTAITAGSYPLVIKATNGVPPDASQAFTLNVVAGAPASVIAFSGSGQNATVTMAFGSSLVAKVQDAFSNPVGGASVIFAAPTSGPSGTFVGSSTTTTDANGFASASFAANTAAGSYAVTASVSGVTTAASFMLTNLPGATTALAINPPTATITAGDSQNYTAEGLDQFNNPTGNLTATTTFTILPDGRCSPVGADPASCTTNVADVNGSSHTVTGTYTNGAKGVASLTVNSGAFSQLQLLVPGETAAPGTTTGKTGTPNIEYVNGKFDVTVNAVDQFFNLASSVTDTIDITSNDNAAKLPVDAALVNGRGQFSITLETVSFNPNKTTITASDVTDNTKTASTSPALEVIVVYTATIAPTMAGTGDATAYTLTVNNSAAPNTNNLESAQISVPGADQGSISGVSVSASNGGPSLNWNYDNTKLPGTLRFVANSDADAVTPGGTITITFTATSNANVTTAPVPEEWTTVAFSDKDSNNSLPLAGPEPTVQIGKAPEITSANTATFTYETPGTSFTVTTTGVPTPTVSESGSVAPGLTFTANGDGTATISGTPTQAGSFPITITAHSGFGPDATQTLTIVVNKADSVSTILSSSEPSVFGQSVTFTATVSAVSPATGTPTGSVTFYADGATQIGTSQTLISGKASVSTSTLSVASHSITAVYSGDNNFNKTGFDAASQAIAFMQDVNKADTSSAVVSSVNPSVFGQSVTFTATVSAVTPGAGTPTGTVQFMDGANPLGSPVALSGGQASFSTSSLTVASHYIKAVYGGDGNFNATAIGASTATPLTQVVNKADSSSVTVSSVNPSVFGQSVTFTATVTAVAPGSGTPTGTVDFKDGSATIASGVALTGGVASFSTSSLIVASHYIKAVYSGDGNFNVTGFDAGSTATPVTQVVNKADSSSVVTSSVNPSVFGQSVTFTATVTAIAPGSGIPRGSVTFMDGTNPLSPAQTLDASGHATFSTSSLSVATHFITASYSGDGNFNGTGTGASTAAALSQIVNKADSLSTVVSSGTPTVFGQSVTFTATVTAVAPGSGTPGGTVQFMDGANPLGTPMTLSGGQASYSTFSVNAGSHSITAVYSGDAGFNKTGVGGSTAPAFTQVVNKADTLSSIASSVNPSTFGQSVTFTATVTAVAPGSGTPTGTVQFMDGASQIGGLQSLNASGQATFTIATLNAATHSITASYTGDPNFNATGTGASTASALSQIVNKANTSTAVSSSLNPSTFGQAVQFTATITNASGTGVTPTGTVQFVVDGSNLGAAVALSASGTATSTAISTLLVSGSPHSVTVNYTNSDGNFNTSNGSLAGGQTVNKAATSTAVASSVNPSVFGQSVTFTATVTNVPMTGVAPTGAIQFVVDGLNFGAPVPVTMTTANSAAATSTATSSLSVTGSPHSVTANYVNSDGNFSNSSGGLSQTVNKDNTSVAVTSSGSPSLLNAPVTFTATVTAAAPGSGTPTGTVTFTYSNTALSLSGTLGTATLNASGVATLTTSALPVNVNKVTATYNSDTNFNSGSGYVNQTVQYAAAGTMCAGDVGHFIRQPINADQSSVFKLGSVVPTKFAVCDANGSSIGTAGVVASYYLIGMGSGSGLSVDESVYSNTPDTAFRWDPTALQWIFNQATKNNSSLNKSGVIYYFAINLNDGTSITFAYALK